MLARGVGAEAVDRHHRRHAELAQIGEMAGEVGKAAFERRDVFLAQRVARHAAMHLQARTVATTTAASGFSPALRHLMSKNFSAPRSAPNPASVTT